MAEIEIAFGLPGFVHEFAWDADPDEGERLIAALHETAQKAAISDEAWALTCFMQAPQMLPGLDRVQARGCAIGIIGWLLQQPTQQPDYPGEGRRLAGRLRLPFHDHRAVLDRNDLQHCRAIPLA
jgi:hypothetical protein